MKRDKTAEDYGITVDLEKLKEENPELYGREILPWLPYDPIPNKRT